MANDEWLKSEIREIKDILNRMPCGTHGERIMSLEQIEVDRDKQKGHSINLWRVIFAAIGVVWIALQVVNMFGGIK